VTDDAIWPHLDITEASSALRTGATTATRIVQAHVERIGVLDPHLRACITPLMELALARASEADARWRSGRPLSPIDGVPLALKDNFALAGVRTTNGTRSMAQHISKRDAVSVARLRAAGVAFVAKVNLDELALGGSCTNPVAGSTLNPWDGAGVPGGSSGGSGAAVSAGMCMAATGSDTGGSIRNPSAWCGVVGLKASSGMIDPTGVVPLSPSLDTVGFLARTVADVAILFAHTADFLVDDEEGRRGFVERATKPASHPTLGIAEDVFGSCEREVGDVCRAAVDGLRGSGHIRQVGLPPLGDALATLLAIMLPEAASQWRSELDEAPEAFGPSVLSLLHTGRAIDDVTRRRAGLVRGSLVAQVERLFDGLDAVLMPSMGLAPRARAYADVPDGPDHPMWRFAAQLTCLWNLCGNPVVSVPCGFTSDGRPVAMQVVGRRGRDGATMRVASLVERELSIPRERLVPTWVAQHLSGASGASRAM